MSGRRAGRGALVVLAGQWLKYLVQLASLVVLARMLTPEDYGLLAMVMAILGAATVIGDFGLSLASIQAPRLSQGQKSNLFWLNTSIGLMTGVVVALIAPLIALFYEEPRLLDLALVLSIMFPLNGIAVQFRAELNRSLKFKWLSATDVGSQLVGFGLAVLAAALGMGVWALAAQALGASIVSLIFSVVSSRWWPGLWQRSSKMKSLLSFGANTFAVQVVNYASSNLDSVLIGRTLGAVTLGLYSRAFQLVSLPLQQLASPLTRVVLPYLTRLTDAASFGAAAFKAQMVLAYGLIGILSILASTSEPLISVVLGPKWTGASTTLEILAIGGLFQCLGYVYYWIFLARARTGMLFWSELAGRAVMAVAMVMWVSRGPEWVAGAGAVGLFVIWLVGTTITVPAIGVRTRPLVSAALRPVALFASAYAVVKGARLLEFPGPNTPDLLQLMLLLALWAAWVGLICAISSQLRGDIRILISLGRVAVERKGRTTDKAEVA